MEVFMFSSTQMLDATMENSFFDMSSDESNQDESTEFRWQYYLAGAESTPDDNLAALAGHKDPMIRKRVAENPNIPDDVQRQLSMDEDHNVRLALSANPSILVEISTQLTKDESEWVRFSLARNRNMPVSMLIKLVRDKQTNIAKRAYQTIEEIIGTSRKYAAENMCTIIF
jgi:hypothetical protein